MTTRESRQFIKTAVLEKYGNPTCFNPIAAWDEEPDELDIAIKLCSMVGLEIEEAIEAVEGSFIGEWDCTIEEWIPIATGHLAS
jgi:hypothetical protein